MILYILFDLLVMLLGCFYVPLMDCHSSARLGELKCYQACALNWIFTTANSVRQMFDSEGMEIAQARAILGDDVFLPVGVEFDLSFHSITCDTFFLPTRVPWHFEVR